MVHAGTVLLENENQVNKLESKEEVGFELGGKKQLSEGRKACWTNLLDFGRCYQQPSFLPIFLKGAKGCRAIIGRQGHKQPPGILQSNMAQKQKNYYFGQNKVLGTEQPDGKS